MKDYLNQELNIGDYVVGIDHNKTSSCFFAGVIDSFTPKMVKVKYDGNRKKRFSENSCLISSHKIVKINREINI